MGQSREEALPERALGPVTVLFGERGGKYPQGNTLVVRGRDETVLIDPSLGLVPRADRLPAVDRVLLSHCHEDHLAGLHLYSDVPVHLHELDLPCIRSLDAFMTLYGYPTEIERGFRKAVVDQFHFVPRDDASGYATDDVFELGGVTIRAVHTPGHTRGHCCFEIRWEGDDGGVLYMGDIDLSSFGPYYGDAWSDLESFERSIERVRELEARWYATFHHIGVLDRDAYLERLARFGSVIEDREARLLAFLTEPRTLDEIATHRFVYRPKDPVAFAYGVELRSMGMHVERLLRDGRVRELASDRYVAA